MVRLTDRPDMTLDVYRGRKTTIQQLVQFNLGLHCVLRHSNKYLGSITLSKICKYIKVSLGE